MLTNLRKGYHIVAYPGELGNRRGRLDWTGKNQSNWLFTRKEKADIIHLEQSNEERDDATATGFGEQTAENIKTSVSIRAFRGPEKSAGE